MVANMIIHTKMNFAVSKTFKYAWAAFGGLVGACFASGVAAHTAYMAPSIFRSPDAAMVTVQSSFTENFFLPEVATVSDDYHVLSPDGVRSDFDAMAALSQIVVAEKALAQTGTYLLTTGERQGRKSQMRRVDDGWVALERGDDGKPIIPANAVLDQFQTLTVSDVYVTKGAPTRKTLRDGGRGLVFSPITHPNEVDLKSGFEFRVTFNDQPMANKDLTIYRGGGAYERPAFKQTVKTNADGVAMLRFDTSGVYLVMTRHQAAAPDGAATPYRSYTTSVTFDVVR